MKNQRSEEGFSPSGVIGFFIGFLSGGLMGATVMLLLAPRTGKRTRSQMQEKGAKLRRQATEGIEDAVAEAGDKAHQFTDSVQNSVHKGVDDLQKRGKEMLTEAKK
jgi:gas vesicle protein